MSAAINLALFEDQGWSFRLDGSKVKAKPPANAKPEAVAELRQHRDLVRTLLAIREGEITLGDLVHDVAVIADRDHSEMNVALDGAAISAGFASWDDATRALSPSEQTTRTMEDRYAR